MTVKAQCLTNKNGLYSMLFGRFRYENIMNYFKQQFMLVFVAQQNLHG